MKKIGLIIAFSALVCSAWAVPARRGEIVKTQPDGTQIVVHQHGDEHFHWMTNDKGEWLKMDVDGFYRVTEALNAEQIEAKRMAAPSRVAQAQKVATPLNIAPRGLVILVNFTDVAFETDKAEMDSMLTGKNYTRDYSYFYRGKKQSITSKGSAWQYFYDSSNGHYDPQFDVIGPVTVSKNMAYYGKNVNNFDAAPWTMVEEACQLVDDSVDFKQYDNNNDGDVDFVYVIYAGYGEADGGDKNTIWPHSYWLLKGAGITCKLDGKYVDLYACGNEMDSRTNYHTGIGTFCHEFSHVLGLPDLYETTGYGTHKTIGAWSILDYGPYNNDGNTPPAYSAYEQFFMGWLMPRLIVDAENVELEELQASNSALLISSSDQHNLIGNDPKPTTFYLLENRQQVGWDEYLPGHGLMLTKVQYDYNKWTNNTVNNSSNRMGVDLIEADGKKPSSSSNGYTGKAGDLFPAGATEYLGITNHSIEDVSEQDGIIYFKYKGGIATSAEQVQTEETIVAIYNILGQKQAAVDIESLPHGTYVVVTTAGSKKIVR